MANAKIKKGDTVVVIAGNDKGKKGEVLRVVPGKNVCYVKGVKLVKKTMKKSKENPNGSIIEVESPVHISNVMLFCSKVNRGVRVGYTVDKTGAKKRKAKGVDFIFD